MYDALTTSYRLSCPQHGKTSVRLSRFRSLEELPGPHHPAVYRIVFACGCGDEHLGLVPHDELDLAPLGLEEKRHFVNLMTSTWFAAGGALASLLNSLPKPKGAKETLPEDMSTASLVGGGLIAGDALAALGLGIAGLLATVFG